MKIWLVAPAMFVALGALAQAQLPPNPVASTPSFGFSLPSVEGTLNYSLSASQSFYSGYGGGGLSRTTALSGSLGYLSSSPDKPFSLVYSGGYLFSSATGYPASSTFQNLAASQVVTTKNWNFVVDDALSYLPESPTTGLSGIPGLGDIGVAPVQIGDEPTQSILTNYATRIGNGLNGGATRKINGSLSVNGSASWQILHFTGDEGIDSDMVSGSIGPSYRLDARSSMGANVVYSYTNDTYLGQSYPFTTEGVNLQYQRQLTRFLSFNVSAGPQRTAGSGATAALIPANVTIVGSGGVTYARRTATVSISYGRATNSGSGVVFGALSDSLSGVASKQLSRNWQAALTASYAKSTSLATVDVFGQDFTAIYGGGQVSRRLGRTFSAYFSYTAVTQNTSNPGITPTAYSGLNQVFAVGITYSPGAMHLGHF